MGRYGNYKKYCEEQGKYINVKLELEKPIYTEKGYMAYLKSIKKIL